jgi:hypothetical protein
MSIGVIVRDHEGDILTTLLAHRQCIIDPTTAALRATIFAMELGHQHVELEDDATQILRAMNKE